MAVHGNFTELTFVNSTTPALNATNMNAIESTLKITDTELARSQCFSWEFYKEMFFNCSQKTIDRFLDYTDWTGTNGPTISEATHSESLIHGRSVKMLQPSNDAEELAIFTTTHTQQNLEKFESNDASTTADLICLLCYISDITYITRITIRLGEDNSNYYYYNWTTGLVNGWNILTAPKSSFSTTGSPSNWQAIDYVAYRGLFAINALNTYVIFNHSALVRADGTTATLMNPFVGNNYSDDWDIPLLTPSSQFLIYKDAQFEEICVLSCMTTGIAESSPDFLGSGLVCSSFSASFRVITRNISNTQGIMWYVDDDNWLLFHIDDADITLTVRYSGATSYYYTAYPSNALLLGSTLVLKIEKIGGSTVRLILIDESGTNEVIEVAGTGLLFGNTTEGEVGIGSSSTNQKASIQDFVISTRRSDFINLPVLWTNNKNRLQYVVKSADESRSTDINYTDDSELILRLKPYGTYKYRFSIYTYGSDAGDFKCRLAATGDVDLGTYKSIRGIPHTESDPSDATMKSQVTAVANGEAYGTTTSHTTFITIEGIATTDEQGGFIKLQWGQYSSHATATVVREDSILLVEKIDDNY